MQKDILFSTKTGEYIDGKMPDVMVNITASADTYGNVSCGICAHHCSIAPEKFGICGVRQNINGVLVPLSYGRIIAFNSDPIEKKPLYHFLPGTLSYSIAAPGCNFKCGFCQNWEISQVNKGTAEKHSISDIPAVSPDFIVKEAIRNCCKSISFTYTEPTVSYEFMKDVSTIAQSVGLKTVMVTNGFMSEKTAEDCCGFIDAFNVDLKSFTDTFYRKYCGGMLLPVLDTIKRIKNNNRWIEITTLLIPGENDSIDEVGAAAEFIVKTDRKIPWHLSRFFPRFRFSKYKATPEPIFVIARKIAEQSGLYFVYTGNLLASNITFCPRCGEELICRQGYKIRISGMTAEKCDHCKSPLEGVWGA